MNSRPAVQILYEDNHILVAIKPPGILSQADGSASADMLTLLRDYVRVRYNKPGQVYLGLVQRLDRPVGGVMVFARTSKAAARLSEQIRLRQIEKYYLAVVRGAVDPPGKKLVDHLVKDKRRNRVHVSPPGTGMPAVLNYQRLACARDAGLSLLAVRLETGRPHQIRVQLAHAGWPISGDRRYGPEGERLPDDQPALYAAALALTHPTRQQRLLFTAEPPDGWPWTLFQADIQQALGTWLTQTEQVERPE